MFMRPSTTAAHIGRCVVTPTAIYSFPADVRKSSKNRKCLDDGRPSGDGYADVRFIYADGSIYYVTVTDHTTSFPLSIEFSEHFYTLTLCYMSFFFSRLLKNNLRYGPFYTDS